MPADRRQFIVAAGAAGLLAACGRNSNARSVATGDMALGSATAPVTMIEYASTMCPHCAEFHATVFPGLKQKYIDAGKLRFVFREFATEPREFAYAGFMISRCVGDTPQKYYDMLGVFFEQQRSIFEAAQVNQGREKLLEIARTAGMSEQAFNTCVADPAAIERIRAVEQKGMEQFKIEGTPTVILDGEVVPNTIEAPYSLASLSALIDAKLAARR